MMDIRRILTIAGLCLAVIRPAQADEPGVVPVRSSTHEAREVTRVAGQLVTDGPSRPPGERTSGRIAAIRKATPQVVTDHRRLESAPMESAYPSAFPSTDSNQAQGQPTPRTPGVVPKIRGSLSRPGADVPSDSPPVVEATPPTTSPEVDTGVPTPSLPGLGTEQPIDAVLPALPTPLTEEAGPPLIPPLSEIGGGLQPMTSGSISTDAFQGDLGAGSVGGGTSLSSLAAQGTFATPEVFGDSLGTGILQFSPERPQSPPPLPRPPVPPRPPSPFESARTAALVPSIRAIKISENQSPAPRDRMIYQFNFYEDVNGAINSRFLSPITDVKVYRHIFGFEKTFFDGMTSFGMRLPLNTVTADSPLRDVGRTETDLGNMEIFGKYVLLSDPVNGRLLSTGLSISPSTGPSRFAGADYLVALNNTTIQPFVGGIYRSGRVFFQGFLSLEVPFNKNDVTMLYNDYAFGYFLYEAADPNRILSSVVPIVEVHVNTPLNHRGIRLDDPAGTPDFVNLTYGTSFQFGQRARLLGAFVTPVTGPRPFDFEVMAAFNLYY